MADVLNPHQFVNGPLANLVEALAESDHADVPLSPGEVGPHDAAVKYLGLTAAPTGRFETTRQDETRLPLDHPDVDIPGVALETYLGGGGQGWVYAGRVLSTDKIVAVKVLARGRDPLDWGAREAILCARVRHPNVLRVLRTQPAGAFWVVLMELVLGDELGRERLEAPEARTCFAQLADALMALTRQRLVHRDIKPANVLLRRPDRSPVLIDFGLAVEFGEASSELVDLSGTPFFMPPEAWRDEPPSPAWDAYALGVTAAVALAGRPEMPTDLPSLRQAKLSGVFERRLTRPIADPELRSWIEQMTAADRSVRLAAVETARGWTVY